MCPLCVGDGCVYEGRIISYTAGNGKHRILWQDGEDEWVTLASEDLTWLRNNKKVPGYMAGLPGGDQLTRVFQSTFPPLRCHMYGKRYSLNQAICFFHVCSIYVYNWDCQTVLPAFRNSPLKCQYGLVLIQVHAIGCMSFRNEWMISECSCSVQRGQWLPFSASASGEKSLI